MPVVGTHDPVLVALSVVVAIVASYTALDLAGRIAAARGSTKYLWLSAAAAAMGGGIWTMHFVAMLAFGMPVQVTYDAGLTLLSLLVAMLATGVSFFVVHCMAAGPVALPLSGAFMGLGIVAMHYTGMVAMTMSAETAYDPAVVALSVGIAVGAATVALWLSLRKTGLVQRLVAAGAMGLAIAGMHYTAMHAATFTAHSPLQGMHAHRSLDNDALALAIAAATLFILFLALISSVVDRRLVLLADRETAALRESERRFRLLVNSVVDYAMFMLDPRGVVTNWNSGAERVKGYASEQILGKHFSCFYTEEDRHNGEPSRSLREAELAGRYETEGWRVRKDGSAFWARVVIDAIRDEDGKLIGFAKTTRDVSERREAQRKLEQTREQLFQAQKMETTGQLTGGIAHDFNNLLAVVLGSLELLRKRLPADERTQRLLENAVQGAQRGAALTQRMLAFARRQALTPEPVDIPALVRGMAELLQRSIGPMVRIETRFPLSLPRAHVDANQLELALVNLAVNARDAMPEAGALVIAAVGEAIGADHPTGLPAGAYLCLSVTDTGEGMDEATLARAAEPFFTTKGIGKGTGLGLSMVHGLAEQSGGKLMLRSRKGLGTTAEIWLPVAAEAGEALPAPAVPLAPAPAQAGRPLVVLTVDDDALVLMGTAAMLEDLGHTAIEAPSGKEALAVLRNGQAVDLILTDQAMPGMTGVQLAEVVRAQWPHVPILLMTGYAELPGGAGLGLPKLNKPFGQAALASAIRDCCRAAEEQRKVVAFKQRRA